MSSQPGISLEQLVSALQRKSIPLPFEMGTFLVLEACERVLQAPARVTAASVWLSPEGEVAVADAPADSPDEACRSLVVLLGELLVRSAPGVPQMLLTLVEQGPSDGEWSLTRLRDDLEASLVPLNRAATRRVLGRLLREVHREGGDRGGAGELDRGALDNELDALLGVEPGMDPLPPPPRPEPEPRREPEDDGGHDAFEQMPTRPMQRSELDPAPVPRIAEGLDDFERVSEGHGRGGTWIGVLLVAVAAALVAAYLMLGRDQSRAALGMEPAPRAAEEPAPAAQPQPELPPAPTHGRLEVSSSPAHAQVLMLVGKGPVEAKGLPLGVASEFVALADGHAPARAVVPPDAAWDSASGAARYELAMQLSPLDMSKKRSAARASELGATRLPRQLGAPSGGLGSVRVVTSPPGASVYQLVGFTPDVRIENLPLEQPVELVVYLGGHELNRLTVTRDDYQPQDGLQLAQLDVELKPR